MKKILLMAIAAITIFSSCSKLDKGEGQSTQKSLKFSVGLSKVKSKSIESPAGALNNADVLANIKSLTLELLSGSDVVLEARDITGADLALIKADKEVLLHNVNSGVEKVRAKMNLIADNTSVNELQKNGANTFLHVMEYAGVGAVTNNGTETDPTDGNVIWKAEVEMFPAMSRFEVTKELSVKYPANGVLPTGVIDGAKADVQALKHLNSAKADFSDAAISAAEANAVAKWKAAHGEPNSAFTYEYTVTYSRIYDQITSVEEVYTNNFITNKGRTSKVLYANGGSGDWNAAAKAAYQKSAPEGTYSNMWDGSYTPITNKVAAYNLFPQSVANTVSLQGIKDGMPHIILKVKYTPNGDVEKTDWITIRAFRSTGAGNPLVYAFEAGKVYQLDLDQVELNNLRATLVVSAIADGKTTPSDPDDEDEDPIDPNPEPENTDLSVKLTIKEWVIVGVTPEW